MTTLILLGAIFFTLALLFYSIGIWSDFIHKQLKPWHIKMFALGVFTDSLGTLFMYLHVGHLIFNAHSISGFIGLFLMIFHFCWGLYVIKNKQIDVQKVFHHFSILVWLFWLISYISGVYIGLHR